MLCFYLDFLWKIDIITNVEKKDVSGADDLIEL